MWFIGFTIFSVYKNCFHFIICAFNSNNNDDDDNDDDDNYDNDDDDYHNEAYHNEAIA